MKLIRRDFYLDRLIGVIGTPDIKVITGVRRCGKSKLLESLVQHVRETNQNANVIQVNFNLIEFEGLREYHALNAYITERYVEGVDNLVCIDEVQMCEGFERCINSLHASERFDIFITGSNAFLLSSDLATLFTGRTFELEVFPFSLKEFAEYHGVADPDQAFDRYVREGGMAGSYVYPNEGSRYRYLQDVLEMLILRDVTQKYKIRNSQQLDRLCDFMMDNVGNVASVNGIVGALGAAGLKTSAKTVAAYLDYLCDAFAFYRVRRYDIRGKRYLSSGDKHYLVDQSLRYAKLGTKNMDWGRVYENIVAIELLRRGYEVYVGTLYQKEVDFVAIRRDEKVYIQVSDDISSPSTAEREFSSLLKVDDAYPKMVIARTKHPEYTHEGVRVVDIARWLMGE